MHLTDDARQVGARLANAQAITHKHALESVVLRAMAAVDSCCPRLGANFGFAILSARDQAPCALHAEEMQLLGPRACEKRRMEFTSGRGAARFALKQVGFENPPPVLHGEKREPLWPAGVAGSITHCYPWSVALVARSSNHLAVGIDLESVARIQDTDISDLVCRDTELHWVRAGYDSRERLAMIFAAKEAVYKAFYPVCRRYIDFKEVELSWVPGQYRFHCESGTEFGASAAPGHPCAIICQRCGDLVFSCLICELVSHPNTRPARQNDRLSDVHLAPASRLP